MKKQIGVSFDKVKQAWCACIWIDGVRHRSTYSKSRETAVGHRLEMVRRHAEGLEQLWRGGYRKKKK